ncbi:TPR domain-containing protein [Xylariaceae sp. FL0804]|nr:TPR domain-containing protein [Xylariaceae sp. FL0804]
MIEIRLAGAKGFGVFAKSLIPKGTRLLAESPLISITDAQPSILAAARLLTLQDRQELLSLSLNEAKRASLLSTLEATWLSFPSLRSLASNREIINIFRNNNFGLADVAGTRAVFKTVARINHSCLPNSQGNFHSGIGQFAVHATRPIAGGEEVTISYLDDQLAVGVVRRKHLLDGYGFTCACPICGGRPISASTSTSTSTNTLDSDARRTDLQRRLAIFTDANTSANAQGTGSAMISKSQNELLMTKTLIGVYEAEGLAGRELATIYLAAAKLSARLGMVEDAHLLAHRGLELEREAVGVDNPLYSASVASVKDIRLEAA